MKEDSKPKAALFEHLQAFLDRTHGQVTLGEIPPIRLAVLAAEGKHARVALVGRRNETVLALLNRLDEGLGKFMSKGIVTDEVVPELKRRGEL
jgi:hypothetical protein